MISLATSRTKTDEQLKGLVYSLTPKIVDHDQPVWQRPAVVGTVLLDRLRHPEYYFLVNPNHHQIINQK